MIILAVLFVLAYVGIGSLVGASVGNLLGQPRQQGPGMRPRL